MLELKKRIISLSDIPNGKYETEYEFTSNNITIKMTNVENVYERGKQFLLPLANVDYNIHTTSVPLSEVTKVVLKVDGANYYVSMDKILKASQMYATKTGGDLSDKKEITPTIELNSDGYTYTATYEMPEGYKYFYLNGNLYYSTAGSANEICRWPFRIYSISIYGYE